MDSTHTTKVISNAIDRLAAALDEGNSEKLTRFLSAMARFHRYSVGNVVLILHQCPDATYVAGFRAWKALGRHVKKGERGIVIRSPVLYAKREDTRKEQRDPREQEPVMRFKAAHVFDVTQTDGEPLPAFVRPRGDPGEHTDRLKALATERGITLDYTDELGTAEGMSCGGTIKLRIGLSPAEEFAVLVHELAHELLHKGDSRTASSKTVRETEAEAVAYVVSQAIGLDAHHAAVDYIRLYGGDRETLAASLDRIQRAASEILQALTQHHSVRGQRAAA